ncbi:hypothetical protein LX36DRAFT_670457 [Colletotrichum falcatum]|nr:hypothetical protein LX36DRAFT_670457 [Colletotrichum falcatum]
MASNHTKLNMNDEADDFADLGELFTSKDVENAVAAAISEAKREAANHLAKLESQLGLAMSEIKDKVDKSNSNHRQDVLRLDGVIANLEERLAVVKRETESELAKSNEDHRREVSRIDECIAKLAGHVGRLAEKTVVAIREVKEKVEENRSDNLQNFSRLNRIAKIQEKPAETKHNAEDKPAENSSDGWTQVYYLNGIIARLEGRLAEAKIDAECKLAKMNSDHRDEVSRLKGVIAELEEQCGAEKSSEKAEITAPKKRYHYLNALWI